MPQIYTRRSSQQEVPLSHPPPPQRRPRPPHPPQLEAAPEQEQLLPFPSITDVADDTVLRAGHTSRLRRRGAIHSRQPPPPQPIQPPPLPSQQQPQPPPLVFPPSPTESASSPPPRWFSLSPPTADDPESSFATATAAAALTQPAYPYYPYPYTPPTIAPDPEGMNDYSRYGGAGPLGPGGMQFLGGRRDSSGSSHTQASSQHSHHHHREQPHMLFCGGKIPSQQAHTVQSHHVQPFKPSILPLDSSSQKRAQSPPPSPKTNGCGALIHLRAFPQGQRSVWVGKAEASEVVVGLDSSYFESAVVAKMMKSACGCVREGVGCAVCGNPLGTRYMPCQAASEGIFSPPASSSNNNNNNNSSSTNNNNNSNNASSGSSSTTRPQRTSRVPHPSNPRYWSSRPAPTRPRPLGPLRAPNTNSANDGSGLARSTSERERKSNYLMSGLASGGPLGMGGAYYGSGAYGGGAANASRRFYVYTFFSDHVSNVPICDPDMEWEEEAAPSQSQSSSSSSAAAASSSTLSLPLTDAPAPISVPALFLPDSPPLLPSQSSLLPPTTFVPSNAPGLTPSSPPPMTRRPAPPIRSRTLYPELSSSSTETGTSTASPFALPPILPSPSNSPRRQRPYSLANGSNIATGGGHGDLPSPTARSRPTSLMMSREAGYARETFEEYAILDRGHRDRSSPEPIPILPPLPSSFLAMTDSSSGESFARLGGLLGLGRGFGRRGGGGGGDTLPPLLPPLSPPPTLPPSSPPPPRPATTPPPPSTSIPSLPHSPPSQMEWILPTGYALTASPRSMSPPLFAPLPPPPPPPSSARSPPPSTPIVSYSSFDTILPLTPRLLSSPPPPPSLPTNPPATTEVVVVVEPPMVSGRVRSLSPGFAFGGGVVVRDGLDEDGDSEMGDEEVGDDDDVERS